jgi:hypothetical protein
MAGSTVAVAGGAAFVCGAVCAEHIATVIANMHDNAFRDDIRSPLNSRTPRIRFLAAEYLIVAITG